MEGSNTNEVVKKDENVQEEINKINNYIEKLIKEDTENGGKFDEEEIDMINSYTGRLIEGVRKHKGKFDEEKINRDYKYIKKAYRENKEHSKIVEKAKEERFKGLNQDQRLEHHDFKARYLNHFAQDYINATIDPSILEENKKSLLAYPLLRERLKNSTLVDLGCGGPDSTELAYQFATAFGVRKYIAVEKYPDGEDDEGRFFEEEDYEDNIKNVQNNDITKKLLEKNAVHILPQCELVLDRDMLGFLLEREEQSNFIMSGVGKEILLPERCEEDSEYKYETRKEKHQNYVNELEIQISRLTPEGGIVIINSSYINLEKFGFKKNYLEKMGNEKMVVWEKLKNKN